MPFGRLHIRPVHVCLRRQFAIGVHSLSMLVSADEDAAQALAWWTNRTNTLLGQTLEQFDLDVTLYMDASQEGWGAHAHHFQASGVWTSQEKSRSVNQLELLVVLHALQTRPMPRW